MTTGLLVAATFSGATSAAWAQAPAPSGAPESPPPAETPAPPTDERPAASSHAGVDDARSSMDRGQQLFAEGKFVEATEVFRAAYQRHGFTAFLFNAAVAAERGGQRQDAISLYERFLSAEPNVPDRSAVVETVARLRGEAADELPSAQTQKADIKSLMLVESEPAGAPVSIWQQLDDKAPPLNPLKPESSPGYRKVMAGLRTPNNVSLSEGTYFILIEAFRDYNPMGSLFKVESGRVHLYRAGLSQGDFVGRLELLVPVGTAKIYVDDPKREHAPRAVGPANLELTPGKHTIEIDAVGFEPFKREVTIVQGETSQLDAKLTRLPYGYVLIRGNAVEIEVEVDDEDRGKVRRKKGPLRLQLPAGDHEVEIDADDRKAWSGVVRVPAGQELSIDAKLEEAPGKGGAILTAVLAAGALAGGIVLRNHVDNQMDPNDELRDPLSAVATGSLVGAGVFTALSIFLFAYDPTDDSTAKISEPREFSEETQADAAPPNAKPQASSSLRLVPFTAAPLVPAAASAGPFAAPTGLSLSLRF